MKAIHKFAEKWCDKFRDQKINYIWAYSGSEILEPVESSVVHSGPESFVQYH